MGAPPIISRVISASRFASDRRSKLWEDSTTINVLRWVSRQRQPRSSSLNTSNFHMPEDIDRCLTPREIGHWHVPCNQGPDMRDPDSDAARVRRFFVKFEIYMDDAGIHHWRLLASDGQVMATSKESYPRREDVRRAIIALQASIPVARIVDGPIIDRRTA